MFAGATGGVLAGFLVSMIYVMFSSRRSNGVLGEHIYTLRDDGLPREHSCERVFGKVGRHKGLANKVLYFHTGRPRILPRRNFDSPAVYDRFWASLKKGSEHAA
jgi:hypothetical protein